MFLGPRPWPIQIYEAFVVSYTHTHTLCLFPPFTLHLNLLLSNPNTQETTFDIDNSEVTLSESRMSSVETNMHCRSRWFFWQFPRNTKRKKNNGFLVSLDRAWMHDFRMKKNHGCFSNPFGNLVGLKVQWVVVCHWRCKMVCSHSSCRQSLCYCARLRGRTFLVAGIEKGSALSFAGVLVVATSQCCLWLPLLSLFSFLVPLQFTKVTSYLYFLFHKIGWFTFPSELSRVGVKHDVLVPDCWVYLKLKVVSAIIR